MATLDLTKAFGSGGLTSSAATKVPGLSGSLPANFSSFGTPDSQSYSNYDPTAAAAAAAKATAQNDFNSARDQLLSSTTGAIGDTARNYGQGILDYLSSAKTQQDRINNQSQQNELSKLTGTQGVLDMVGHGIKSGGVVLANKNAGTSSATDAIAQAYADIGRRQLSGVGNQYEMGKNGIAQSQTELDRVNADQIRKSGNDKTNAINAIVNSAADKISTLNAQAASAALPDRLDIESQKEQIRQQAMAALQQYDQQLSQGIASNGPSSGEANKAAAAKLAAAGTAPANAFSYSTETPAQFQNTGPFASELPIFTLPKKQTA